MHFKKIKPAPGQESVWDYPRPPRLEPFAGHIRVVFNNEIIYDYNQAFRILETSHPPTYYLPIDQFNFGTIKNNSKTSYCEYKGLAHYFDLAVGDQRATACAWYYPQPNKRYHLLKDHLALYAHTVDACYVNDEQVQAQPGDFYGGWITSNIVGPFKGAAGTWGW